MNHHKEQLLTTLRAEIARTQHKIEERMLELKDITSKGIEKMSELKIEDQMMLLGMKADAEKRLEELGHLRGSPFFTRCDIIYKNGTVTKGDKITTLYFAKYQFSEESIFSWVAPISSIRFEAPGDISYKLPDGTIERARLVHKEQYMIVDGKVLFFAQESSDKPRDLIYQEHFSSRKNGFVLPEIVAVMEKAQDQVIRAHHVGPFVISGPAGSGKTTLALHRVGYLVQAPDTASHYPSSSIIVFVQDTGTKEYFSHLLPELGIKDVKITTFSEWTMEVLGMDVLADEEASENSPQFVVRPGETEEEKDMLEYEKLQALREGKVEGQAYMLPKYTSDHSALLEKAYKPYLSKRSRSIFKEQMKTQRFDRIDLTLLLTSFFRSHAQLEVVQEYFTPTKKGELRKKTRRTAVQYSLMVVDEFQNYMPEQLAILKRVLHEEHQSIIYVGDMAQQVQLGTIREWKDIGEQIEAERKVVLQKVYRNTKQILRYVEKLGYRVSIPDGLKEGPDVVECVVEEIHDEVAYIEQLVKERMKEDGKDGKDEKEGKSEEKGKKEDKDKERGNVEVTTSFGILTKNSEQQADLRRIFSGMSNVHISTIAEAQGVEFDVVVLAGIHPELFTLPQRLPAPLLSDKKRIEKDLLYVGLTRAIRELHVVGSASLEEVVRGSGVVRSM